MKPIIIGAGLSGLIAASLIPEAQVYEKGSRDQRAHKALLRFRSAAVGDALGIPFRRVTVRKGLWSDGKFCEPSIRLANMYAQKVIGRVTDRSIWKLETQDRFIAPENLAEILIERLGSRVDFEANVEPSHRNRDIAEHPYISTAPMSVNLKLAPIPLPEPFSSGPGFEYAPITVHRWRIKGCDVHQTVYFPDSNLSVYRASITGDLLIVECMNGMSPSLEEKNQVLKAFCLYAEDLEKLDSSEQRFGKIAPIDETLRKRIIRQLTLQHNFYSLGRFATWRNILLDDVLNDVYVIKRLLNSSDYDAARIAAGADR